MFRGDITGYLQTFNENDGLPNEEVSSVVHCGDQKEMVIHSSDQK